MQFDLTLGSSWPFGGPFVPEELSGQSVLPFSIDVEGPCRFSKDLTTVVYGKVVGAVMGKMEQRADAAGIHERYPGQGER